MQSQGLGNLPDVSVSFLPCLNIWGFYSKVRWPEVASTQCPFRVGEGCPPTSPGRQKFLCLQERKEGREKPIPA